MREVGCMLYPYLNSDVPIIHKLGGLHLLPIWVVGASRRR